MAAKESDLVARLLAQCPLKAAGFIVTLYGDVVVPRGGVAWMGNIIDTCAEVGISETLVRTAVSRLVAAGQLSGEREGRRSFYRLSASAHSEFDRAAGVLYGPADAARWHFVYVADPAVDEKMQALERAGYARLDARLAVGPARPDIAGNSSVVFSADASGPAEALRAFAHDNWDLALHAAAYKAFLAHFGAVAERIEEGAALTSTTALTLRLLLVHRFRSAALRDPHLPAAALPLDWPGAAARHLFSRLYRELSPLADEHVARNFVTALGPLPASTETTDQRLSLLALETA